MIEAQVDPRIALAVAAVAPDVDAATWAAALNEPMVNYSILKTDKRLAMFVGQLAVESEFKNLEEDLRYSTAARLQEVWPSQFETVQEAEPYVDNPERLANHVYANRMGNGDEASGDGWKFRGAGLIQLTGRSEFEAFAGSIGRTADEVAPLLVTPEGAAESACWFWAVNGLNLIADRWDIQEVTKMINGGLTGLDRRNELCNAALAAITAASGFSTSNEVAKMDTGSQITARLNAEEAAIGPTNPGPVMAA